MQFNLTGAHMTNARNDADRTLLISFHSNPRVAPLIDGSVKPDGVDLISRFPTEKWIDILAQTRRAIGITPVNHTLIIQKRLLAERPELAIRMLQAFERSKMEAYRSNPAARALFPEYNLDVQRRAFGDDPYPYGFNANRQTLELVAEQLEIDGIIKKRPDINTLVAESVLDS